MGKARFDVIVVGAGIAGCTAAILYAREGHRVALVERSPDLASYKQLCTHFIQAGATPTMRRLGIDKVIEAAGGNRNNADIWTRHGWIFEPVMHDEHGQRIHGYNIRREVLDPALRQMAVNTKGVHYFGGSSVTALERRQGRVSGIVLNDVARTELNAELVVAADGRNSHVADLAGITCKESENRRGAVFAHYKNVRSRAGDRSLMWLTERGIGYVFQNDDGISVVTAMPDEDEMAAFERDPEAALLAFHRSLPDAPKLDGARRVSEVIKAKKYPNRWRPPVAQGLALIGDAALSADPLWGIGCGWAFQTAEWLVDATSAHLHDRAALQRGLRAYARHHRWFVGGHKFVITDYSRRKNFNAFENLLYAAAARDPRVAERLYRFGTRIDSLWSLLTPAALAAMVWAVLRRPAVPQRAPYEA